MNAFAKIDRETFLRFAAGHPEQRYELERGRIVQQMTGGTRRHGIVGRRIARIIEDQIDQAKWSVAIDRGVGVGTSERYPDVVVEPVDHALDDTLGVLRLREVVVLGQQCLFGPRACHRPIP